MGEKVYPDLIKGVRTTVNADHIPENLMKGIIRAKHEIHVNKDGTIRFDMSELPLTHFKPEEIYVSLEKLCELGYTHDIHDKPITDTKQIIEIKPQDVILPIAPDALDEQSNKILVRTTKFVDELLQKMYGQKPFYNVKTKEISFSFPFEWNQETIDQTTVIHEEVLVPKTFGDLLVSKYVATLNGLDLPESMINIDDFSSVTHKFYLVRDGRDVINSLMHFVTNPITLKRYPEYRIVDPVTLYEDYAYFDRQVTVWRDHVRSIFSLREQYLLIRFEDLINNKKNTIERIGNYLGLQVQIEEIMQKTSFSTMKKQANEHVRKGKQGDWKNYFTTIHLERFNRIAGSELEMLGYELVDEL